MQHLDFFISTFQSQQFSAIYTKNHHSVYDVQFFLLEQGQLTNCHLDDSLFFKQLSQQYNISKNELLKDIHRFKPEGKEHFYLPIPGGSKVNHYIFIPNVIDYLTK